MAIKENFEYESLHDPQSVADYIKAIRKGIAARSIRFTSGDDEMEMQPSDLLTLSVRARKKGGEKEYQYAGKSIHYRSPIATTMASMTSL